MGKYTRLPSNSPEKRMPPAAANGDVDRAKSRYKTASEEVDLLGPRWPFWAIWKRVRWHSSQKREKRESSNNGIAVRPRCCCIAKLQHKQATQIKALHLYLSAQFNNSTHWPWCSDEAKCRPKPKNKEMKGEFQLFHGNPIPTMGINRKMQLEAQSFASTTEMPRTLTMARGGEGCRLRGSIAGSGTQGSMDRENRENSGRGQGETRLWYSPSTTTTADYRFLLVDATRGHPGDRSVQTG